MGSAQVVTLSVQVGSDGFAIARGVAARMGFRYFDWQITSRAFAQDVAVGRDQPAFADRIMARLSAATILEEEVPAALMPPNPEILKDALTKLSERELRTDAETVVRDLALEGKAVIVGHGSQVVLQGWPGVLKVLTHGSFEKRAARLAAEQRSRPADVVQMLTELDAM